MALSLCDKITWKLSGYGKGRQASGAANQHYVHLTTPKAPRAVFWGGAAGACGMLYLLSGNSISACKVMRLFLNAVSLMGAYAVHDSGCGLAQVGKIAIPGKLQDGREGFLSVHQDSGWAFTKSCSSVLKGTGNRIIQLFPCITFQEAHRSGDKRSVSYPAPHIVLCALLHGTMLQNQDKARNISKFGTTPSKSKQGYSRLNKQWLDQENQKRCKRPNRDNTPKGDNTPNKPGQTRHLAKTLEKKHSK